MQQGEQTLLLAIRPKTGTSLQIKDNALMSKDETQFMEEAQLAASTAVGAPFPAATPAAGALATYPVPIFGAKSPLGSMTRINVFERKSHLNRQGDALCIVDGVFSNPKRRFT